MGESPLLRLVLPGAPPASVELRTISQAFVKQAGGSFPVFGLLGRMVHKGYVRYAQGIIPPIVSLPRKGVTSEGLRVGKRRWRRWKVVSFLAGLPCRLITLPSTGSTIRPLYTNRIEHLGTHIIAGRSRGGRAGCRSPLTDLLPGGAKASPPGTANVSAVCGRSAEGGWSPHRGIGKWCRWW
jgi:hypothetical protein